MEPNVIALILAGFIAGGTDTTTAPNSATMSFKEFVEASGCVIVDKGGYSNLEAVGGGNCQASVVEAFTHVPDPELPTA